MSDYIECKICHKYLKAINNAHLNYHGYTSEQYKKEFNCDILLSSSVHKKVIQASKKQANNKKNKIRDKSIGEKISKTRIERLKSGEIIQHNKIYDKKDRNEYENLSRRFTTIKRYVPKKYLNLDNVYCIIKHEYFNVVKNIIYNMDNYVKTCKSYKKQFLKFEKKIEIIEKKIKIEKYYNDKIKKFEQIKNVTVLDFNNNTKKVKFKCNSCENIKTLSSSIMNESQLCNNVCSECSNTSQRSLPEYELEKLTKSYSYTITSDRKILNGKELDLYMPNIKLAIEYCGLRWHSLRYVKYNQYYHYEKYQICKNNNIDLITIFEDEYVQNKNLLFKKILYKIKNKNKLNNFISSKIEKHDYENIIKENSFSLYNINSDNFFKITDYEKNILCVFSISEKNNYVVIDNFTVIDYNFCYIDVIVKIIKLYFNKKIFFIDDLRYSFSNELVLSGFIFKKYFQPIGWKVKGQKRFVLNDRITTESTIYDCGYNLFYIK